MRPDALRFGRFEIQPQERLLRLDGAPVALGGRAFDVLLALAQRPGQLVTKQVLLDLVWGDADIGEANLTVQVSGLRKLLGDDVIATVPGHGYRFVAEIAQIAAKAPEPSEPTAAPPLVGRDADLRALHAALQRPGCVTLAGSAGVGKTSLARALAAAWPDGALWLDLDALTEGGQIEAALARALAVPLAAEAAPAVLAARLGARLLVLDNAEHLVEAAAALAGALLRAAPALHLLVTSQWPLALAQERVHRLQPLDLAHAALELLLRRARAADHRYAPAPAAMPLLQAICARLDGLPLALEMAGARLPALGASGVHDALASRFAVLNAGYRDAASRHRSLRDALAWSHGLLGEPERRLFRALAVFPGGFTLELAQAVASDQTQGRWEVADRLSLLVERSLVAGDGNDPPRYRLLETMRAYALEQLAAAGEEAARRRRLALAVHALFEPAYHGVAQRATALAEYDAAREAVAWAIAHDPALALPLATAISRATTYVSWRTEACAWLESCAALAGDASVAPAACAAWWGERARQRVIHRDPEAPAIARRALQESRQLGDAQGMFDAIIALIRGSQAANDGLPAWCDELDALAAAHPEWPPMTALKVAGARAHACHLRGDLEGKLAQRLQEHALATRGGWPLIAEAAETNIVAALQQLGRHEPALARADALLARIGTQESLNAAYAWLGRIGTLVSLGRHAEVRADAPQALALLRRFGVPLLSDVLALMAAREGRPRAAALLIGYARAAYAAAGRGLDPDNVAHLAQAETDARARLAAAEFDRLAEQGRALDESAAERVGLAQEDVP